MRRALILSLIQQSLFLFLNFLWNCEVLTFRLYDNNLRTCSYGRLNCTKDLMLRDYFESDSQFKNSPTSPVWSYQIKFLSLIDIYEAIVSGITLIIILMTLFQLSTDIYINMFNPWICLILSDICSYFQIKNVNKSFVLYIYETWNRYLKKFHKLVHHKIISVYRNDSNESVK